MPLMKKVFNTQLIISILLFLSFIIVRFVLGLFGLMFRAWINLIWLAGASLLFVYGFTKLYISIKGKKIKLLLTILMSGFLLFMIMPIPFIGIPLGLTYAVSIGGDIGVFPHREDVLEIDEHKIVAYHRYAFWDSEVEIYEYKNPFVVGNDCLLWCYGYSYDKDGEFYAYDEMHSYSIEDIMNNK